MHFLNWVLEKQDEPGNLGVFAKVLWQDINNGCGARYTTPLEWRGHFDKKHPRTKEKLNALLSQVYLQYADSFNEEK